MPSSARRSSSDSGRGSQPFGGRRVHGSSTAGELGRDVQLHVPAESGDVPLQRGPLSSDWLPARGRVEALLLFVDFPDAPANATTINQLAALHTVHIDWFEEASYGRFGVGVTVAHDVFRLPRPTSTYTSLPQSIHHPDVFADAIAAADGTIDFSRYQAVFVIGARGWTTGDRQSLLRAGRDRPSSRRHRDSLRRRPGTLRPRPRWHRVECPEPRVPAHARSSGYPRGRRQRRLLGPESEPRHVDEPPLRLAQVVT